MKLKGVLVVTTILAALQIASATTILFENFSGLITWPPTGWAIDSTGNCRRWVRRGSGQVFRTDTSAGVVIANYSNWGQLTGTSYLRTPSLNFSSPGIESLSYYFRCPGLGDTFGMGSSLDTMKVEVSTNGTSWNAVKTIDSNYIRGISDQTAVRDTGVKERISLAAYNGQTSVYIRWMLYDNWPGNVGTNRYFNIDSVYVFDRPAGVEENRFSLTADRLTFNISPNPFTNYTRINFNCSPTDFRTINIYDATGKLIRTLTETNTNTVIWDGRSNYGQIVLPGIYFVRLETSKTSEVKKLLIMR